MLRDIRSGLILAAVTASLYALGLRLGPLQWGLGSDAHDLLMLVGVVLTVSAFVAEVLGSRVSRGPGAHRPYGERSSAR